MHSFDIRLDAHGRLESRLPEVDGSCAIYVFHSGPEVIRVGETTTGTKRIRCGFNQELFFERKGKRRKNNYAYPWREAFANQEIRVDYFALDPGVFGNSSLRRALEAEVTYALRQRDGRWPRCMSEIHFLEKHRENPALGTALERILTASGNRP